MLKKMLIGSFLLVMIGAVVVGGISLFNRSEDAHAWQGRGRNDRNVVAQGADQGDQGRGRGSQEADVNAGQRRGQGSQEADANASQGRGQGQGNSQTSRAEPEAEIADWQTLEGTVVEMEELVIETADGQTVQVGLGPSHYRESQGFVLQVGDSVKISGYFEDGEFKAGQVEKLDTGESIVLRDASGRPMWAGRGNRKNAVSYDAQTQ